MRYFPDTEFLEDGKTIMPISLGIVAEDGRELYVEMQFDQARVEGHLWLRENVLPHLHWSPEDRLDGAATAAAVLEFVGEDPAPEFWAYFADYDWVVICQIFGTMMRLPKAFPKFCMDLQQWYVQRGRPDGVKPPQPVDAHHALADARWNAQFYERLAAHGRTGESPNTAAPTAEDTQARRDAAAIAAWGELLGTDVPDGHEGTFNHAFDLGAASEAGNWQAEYDRLCGEVRELAADGEMTVVRAENAEQALEEARTVVDEQHAEIVTLRTERQKARTERDALWVLLDDIDTASDMFKDDYVGLARYTYRKQQERHSILKSDGHSIVPLGEDFPEREVASGRPPMATNASPAESIVPDKPVVEPEYQAEADAAASRGERVPAPGVRHFGKRSDGKWGCDTCCTGDRCDDPTHCSRRNCPVCGGSGAIPDDLLVDTRTEPTLPGAPTVPECPLCGAFMDEIKQGERLRCCRLKCGHEIDTPAVVAPPSTDERGDSSVAPETPSPRST